MRSQWMQVGVLRLLLPPAVVLVLIFMFWSATDTQWAPPSMHHPLGTDEFGRDLFASVLSAGGISLVKGIAITAATLAVSVVVAELITIRHSSAAAAVVRGGASVVESVPIVLWVFIAIISVPGPRIVVVGVAFGLVVMPIAAHLFAGEFFRLRGTPFVEAAYHLGAGELRVVARYILPNAISVLLPFAVQVLGAAIAVDGAIGVIGLGNRSDLDLGIFLLRGKENFFLHPQIFIVAIMMYAALYAYLLWLGMSFQQLSPRRTIMAVEERPISGAQL